MLVPARPKCPHLQFVVVGGRLFAHALGDVVPLRLRAIAESSLALLQRLLPGITAREVSSAFAVVFDPSRALVTVELPAGDDVPAEAKLLALARTAVAVKPGKPTDVARATTLLAALPRGGTVVESVPHAASGVTSLWLDNGVRVHHRRMDQRKGEASIAITLAGGPNKFASPEETIIIRTDDSIPLMLSAIPCSRVRTS